MAQDLIKMGMVGSGHWDTALGGQRPTNYNEKIFYLFPNGDTPLTGMLSKLPSRIVDDTRFNWFDKDLPSQGGSITAIYSDTLLATGYASTYPTGASEDNVVYVKVAELVAEEFKADHQVTLFSSTYQSLDTTGRCVGTHLDGASSYIAVKLLEDDDNGASLSTPRYLGDCDKIFASGTINAEGTGVGTGIVYEPSPFYNYTQNFRTPYTMSGDALVTHLRTGDARQRYRREELQLHAMEEEFAFLHGVRTQKTGANNQLARTTMGLTTAIRTNASANVDDFRTNSSYIGEKWLDFGIFYLDDLMETVFKYGSTSKFGFTGAGALKGLAQAVRETSDYNIDETTIAYGLNVRRIISPMGTLFLMIHPLFNHRAHGSYYNSFITFDPGKLTYCTLPGRDTRLIRLKNNPDDPDTLGIDGIIEEYRTSAGLEFHNMTTFGLHFGIGQDA